MRIALVVHDFDSGFGQGRYCTELVRHLGGKHEFHVFANRFEAGLNLQCVYHWVPALRMRALSTIYSFLFVSEFQIYLRRYDIVHAQGLSCWSADLITAHICNQARYQSVELESSRGSLFARLVIPLERAFYRHSKARLLIAVSSCCAREIKENYGWNRPVEIIHHGVDTHAFCPGSAEQVSHARARYGLKSKDWVWLFAGEAVKGLNTVIKLLPDFADAVLLVVSRSNCAANAALAQELGVRGRIIFAGPQKEPAYAFRAADVFVYPSRKDSFGLVVSEAMAAGLPVIAGAGIGAAELIQNDRNGLLCSPDEPSTVKSQLAKIRANPEWARHIGRAARETACQNPWERCAQKTETVYEQVNRLNRF